MKISVSQDGFIELEEVYVGVDIVTSKASYGVCERDGVLEIACNGAFVRIDEHGKVGPPAHRGAPAGRVRQG